MCGVVSISKSAGDLVARDSPHVRGCIAKFNGLDLVVVGFPACAGLYLLLGLDYNEESWIPRMCGAVSR